MITFFFFVLIKYVIVLIVIVFDIFFKNMLYLFTF